MNLCISFSAYGQCEDISNDLVVWREKEKSKNTFLENKYFLDSIFRISQVYECKVMYGACHRALGVLYKDCGQYDSAIKNYIKAAEFDEKFAIKTGLASDFNQVGNIYYYLFDTAKALSFYRKALDLYEEGLSYRGVNSVADNLSEIYLGWDSIPQATFYNAISRMAMIKMSDTTDIGYNYYILGLIYFKQKKYDSSLKYLQISTHRFTVVSDFKGIIPSYNSIAKLYGVLGQYDSAIHYHNNALDVAKKYQYRPLLVETYDYLYKVYAVIGDTISAFKYLEKGSQLKDSMLSDAKIKAIVDADVRYNTKVKDRKITEQSEILKLRYLLLVIVIIISIAVLIIAVLLIRSSRNKRRLAQNEVELQRKRVDEVLQKQEVENVNAMLKGQDNERKRIAQELHDRLGSILSTIKLHFSSVEEQMQALKEQQNKSYGEARLLLDEAVDEVRRISHDLYEGSLARFGFKTALLQLIDAIEKANAVKIIFIDNNIDGTVYKAFEQDLYRITQELLSNSLKYSGAKEITIQLTHLNGCFKYMYEDNGKGFDTKILDAGQGIGYKNIAARVSKINGNWHLDSLPGHGMTLLIEIADENH